LPPSQRSEPHTPGGSSGLRFQALHPFPGLRRDNRGSAPPVPARRRRPNDAAGFASRYGPLSCSPQGAFDAGLRPGPFPDRAASLLPGLLAATRTGLAPAGDNELMSDQVISTNHPRLPGAHRDGRMGAAAAIRRQPKLGCCFGKQQASPRAPDLRLLGRHAGAPCATPWCARCIGAAWAGRQVATEPRPKSSTCAIA
jgi:hypothetical protein